MASPAANVAIATTTQNPRAADFPYRSAIRDTVFNWYGASHGPTAITVEIIAKIIASAPTKVSS